MKTSRLALIVAFYIFLNIYVFGANLVSEHSTFILIGNLALAIAASTACLVDSFVIGRPVSLSTRWMIVVYWPVTVPFYLIWSRGSQGLWLLAVHVMLCCIVAGQAVVLGVFLNAWLMQ